MKKIKVYQFMIHIATMLQFYVLFINFHRVIYFTQNGVKNADEAIFLVFLTLLYYYTIYRIYKNMKIIKKMEECDELQ